MEFGYKITEEDILVGSETTRLLGGISISESSSVQVNIDNSFPAFVTRREVIDFSNTHEGYFRGTASRAFKAIDDAYMGWTRYKSDVEAGVPHNSVEAMDYNAWEETGLEMVYAEGIVKGYRNFVIRGHGDIDYLSAIGPTIDGLYGALEKKKLFVLRDFGPSAEALMVGYVNHMELGETLVPTPKSQAVKISGDYSKDIGYYPY